MDFRILGPLEVERNARPIALTSHKQKALLAILIIAAPRVVSTDRLLNDLWGEDARGKENTLWTYISRLRSALEPDRRKHDGSEVLCTKDHGYALDIPSSEIDARRFEAKSGEGTALIRDDPRKASELLNEALAMWRGPALADFAYEEFARPEILRLEELRLVALGDRIDADLRMGESRQLIAELEAIHGAHPLRERFVAQLMLALFRSGRQADALRAFERFRGRVGEELGVEPSPELARLEEQVLLHDPGIRAPERLAGSTSEGLQSAPNPFKGLRPFAEEDSAVFFGRDRVLTDVLRRVGEGARMVALVGPSGSGKSSILRAGVIPALRKDTVGGEWLIAEMVPGAHPFAELEAALLRASLDTPDSLSEQLAHGTTGILRAILRVLPDRSSRMALAIDQFEELFTLVEDEETRVQFLGQLVPLLDDPHGRVLLAITLRSDFYGRPLDYPDFGTQLGRGVINVTPMRPDELEAAVRQPAAFAGASIEASLLAALIADVIGQPGGLPLFEYTLTELYERREGDVLTLATYREMGGVAGAIRQRAEDLYAALDDQRQRVLRELMLRLVTVGSDESWNLRRVPASELIALDADVVDLQQVIDLYVKHRFLTLDRDKVTGSPSVEVAHEALLDEWGRFHDWIVQASRDLRMRSSLDSVVEEWESEDHDAGYLLAGTRLEHYVEWSRSTTIGLTKREREFILESSRLQERTEREDEERRRREATLRRRASIRLWGILALLSGGLVALAMALTGVFQRDLPEIGLIYPVSGDLGLSDLALQGFEEAQRSYDLDTAVITPLASAEEDLARLCEDGFDAVFVVSGFFLDVGGGGPECVDTLVIGVDWPPPQAVPGVDAPNVVQAVISPFDGAYLAGAAAALTSQTGTVGFVGGMPIAPVELGRGAFEEGARSVDPDIEVESIYLSLDSESEAFYDAPRAKVATETLIASDVDVVYHSTVFASDGVLQAVREASVESGEKHWFIGSGANDYLAVPALDRQYVLASVVKRPDVIILDLTADLVDGTLTPGVHDYSLGNGGIELSLSDTLDADDGDRLKVIQDSIESGRVVFNGMPQDPPTFRPP